MGYGELNKRQASCKMVIVEDHLVEGTCYIGRNFSTLEIREQAGERYQMQVLELDDTQKLYALWKQLPGRRSNPNPQSCGPITQLGALKIVDSFAPVEAYSTDGSGCADEVNGFLSVHPLKSVEDARGEPAC